MTAPKRTEDVFAGMIDTLSEPSRWTKGFAARDHHGMPVDVCSPRAMCWCLDGARDKILFEVVDPALRAMLDEESDTILHDLCRDVAPSAVNDDRSTTHADIMDLLNRAYASARSSSSSLRNA